MAKPRVHNEWFRSVSLGNRKSCPSCGDKLEPGEKVWSWGEYVRAKWRTVMHFCKHCYEKSVCAPLLAHAGPCGCKIELVAYGGERLPEWLVLVKPVIKTPGCHCGPGFVCPACRKQRMLMRDPAHE